MVGWLLYHPFLETSFSLSLVASSASLVATPTSFVIATSTVPASRLLSVALNHFCNRRSCFELLPVVRRCFLAQREIFKPKKYILINFIVILLDLLDKLFKLIYLLLTETLLL